MDLIKSDLSSKNREGALKYAYWEQRKGIPYKFYRAISVTQGTFLGKTLRPSIIAILKSNFRYVFFEIATIADLKFRISAVINKFKQIAHNGKGMLNIQANPIFMVQSGRDV